MGEKQFFRSSKALAPRIVFTALLTLILAGCGGSLLGSGKGDANTLLWSHRDQYVRIEPQDRGIDAPQPNEHPANFTDDEIRTMLGSLEVKFEGKRDLKPVFTAAELDILAPAVSQGLAKASPKQDVTFAVVGIHREMISFSYDRAIITGRIFVQNGNLNLILGRLHEEWLEDEDRRMFPLLPGSRKASHPLPHFSEPWKVAAMPGLQTRTVAGQERSDWLMLNPDQQLWKAAIAEKKEAKETAKAAFQEASEVRETSSQLEAEQQQLRTEIQEMKQTIEEMKRAPVTAPAIVPAVAAPAAPTVSAPAATAPADLKKIEERLGVLQRVRDKGWITEQDFQAKKQEILDSL